MSQTQNWIFLAVISGMSLLIGVQAYAQDENVTSMGNVTNMENATNGTAWIGNATNATNMGNVTTTSDELEQTGKIAAGAIGDGG